MATVEMKGIVKVYDGDVRAVDTGKHAIVARVPPHHLLRAGEDAFFEVNMDKVTLFDLETEKTLNGERV